MILPLFVVRDIADRERLEVSRGCSAADPHLLWACLGRYCAGQAVDGGRRETAPAATTARTVSHAGRRHCEALGQPFSPVNIEAGDMAAGAGEHNLRAWHGNQRSLHLL